MITFIAVAGIMVAVALALMLPPILSKKNAVGAVRDSLNVTLFKDRVAELDSELENETLDRTQYDKAVQELEKDLLLNTGGEPQPQAASGSGRWAAALVAVALPIAALLIYSQLGDAALLTKAPQNVAQAQQVQTSKAMGDMATLIDKLRERMKSEPDNVKGWVLLGRSLMMLKRYPEAADAYAKAYALNDQDPSLMGEYAEVMAMAHNGSLDGKPRELVKKALEIDPNSDRALWLAGIDAYDHKRFAEASEHWMKLLPQLPQDGDTADMVRSNIADARAKAGLPPVSFENTVAKAPAQGTSGGASVQLHVTLAPELAAKAAPEDAVFIYARATDGSRMPLAIVRKQVKDLPITVTLDDSMAMMPTRKLSSFPEVVLAARVSKSGNAMTQPGDLTGDITAKVDAEGVQQVIIDRVIQ